MVNEIDTQETPKKGSMGRMILLLLLLGFVLAMIVVPNFVKGRLQSGNGCVNSLRQIAGAKNSWALEQKKAPGTAVSPADEISINKYLKGEQRPRCPAGGTINYNSVGEAPTCSVPGHTV